MPAESSILKGERVGGKGEEGEGAKEEGTTRQKGRERGTKRKRQIKRKGQRKGKEKGEPALTFFVTLFWGLI